MTELPSAILLVHCPDRPGLVHAVTDFILQNRGNIIDLDQHVDTARSVFFMRVEWDLSNFAIPPEKLQEYFDTLVAQKFDMTFSIHLQERVPRMAIFVTRLSHCLYDLLSRCEGGEWHVDVPVIISNHPELEDVARKFGVEYHHIPVSKDNKMIAERQQREILESYGIDFVVLARYMQIVSQDFISAYPNRMINIHHSFLPAFPGAKPYHSAHERGVKIIGATSHYVTADLDAGPIIEQDVVRVSHKDTVQDLIRKGQDLEKVVLARAVWHHLRRNILVYENQTVLFNA